MKEHAMKLKPLYNRVLLRRLDAKKEEGKGRIIIPDTAKEKPLEGTIVAVGSGKLGRNGERIPLHVKVGDRVLIGKYSGQEIMIEDVEHLILKEDEILGIIG
jgi:chaperonin GroES